MIGCKSAGLYGGSLPESGGESGSVPVATTVIHKRKRIVCLNYSGAFASELETTSH